MFDIGWSLGFCMIVSVICPAPHDGLFSNDRQTKGCTLSPVRVQNPESQEAIKLNCWQETFSIVGAKISFLISLHYEIRRLWLRPPTCMSGLNKVRVKRVQTIKRTNGQNLNLEPDVSIWHDKFDWRNEEKLADQSTQKLQKQIQDCLENSIQKHS